jgi:hypothetical protein
VLLRVLCDAEELPGCSFSPTLVLLSSEIDERVDAGFNCNRNEPLRLLN